MTSEGPNSVITPLSDITDDTSIGTKIWGAPSNAGISDSNYAAIGGTITSSYYDWTLKLVKAGTIVGDNKADQATAWSGTIGYVDTGTNTEMWGTTWTYAQINAVDFGVVLSIKDIDDGNYSHYLKALNFGFSIPVDATINGIIVSYQKFNRVGSRSIRIASVDHVVMTVYYTAAGGGGVSTQIRMSGDGLNWIVCEQ